MEFRLFGTVEAYYDNHPIILGSSLQQRLLGVLALNLGAVVRTSQLIATVTDGPTGHDTRRSMQNAVVRLRKSLAHDDGVSILTVGSGYVLVTAPDSIDLYRAAALIHRSRREPDPGIAAKNLETAMTMWRTPVFGWLATPAMRHMAEQRIGELLSSGFVPRFEVPAPAAQGS
jgi:hypothetical protein